MSIVVSVVMPSFNSEKHIGEAIRSVQGQSCGNFEVLVVDGGSRDRSKDVVRDIGLRDPRIRLLENPDDQGPAHARSVGVLHAQGRYVAFLDADDYWLPEKLAAQSGFMTETAAQFSYTRYRSIAEDGGRIGCVVPMKKSYTYRQALRHRGIGTLTVMVERALLTQDVIGVWRRRGGEEYLWWLLVLRKGVTARLVDRDLARYRDTAGSLSKNQLFTLRSVWDIYRSELGLSRLQAAWNYSSYFTDSACRKIWLGACAALNGSVNPGRP
jgi:teichuronic acid biosynthesis glycosyltransferase TuaG